PTLTSFRRCYETRAMIHLPETPLPHSSRGTLSSASHALEELFRELRCSVERRCFTTGLQRRPCGGNCLRIPRAICSSVDLPVSLVLLSLMASNCLLIIISTTKQ